MQITNEELILGWSQLTGWWQHRFGKTPDLNAVLFMIGLRELGLVKEVWKKEEKMDIIHIAICTLLGLEGYYSLERYDSDGWPHFDQVKELPEMEVFEQEVLLKKNALRYFANEGIFASS